MKIGAFLIPHIASAIVFLLTVPSLAEPYLWPLPFTTELTSIFGDFRARRYHVGIDVRTGGAIGKVVVAPMDGYISRVRTSYFGYGKALHLTMKDGNSAVFAHLSAFAPEIEKFIREKQIASETYAQDVELSAGRFEFHRGDTIALSGNTGIGAPHLHFEVRTPGNVPLNPLTLPGLEVEDRIAPELRKLRLIGIGNDELAAALGWNLEYVFRRGSRGDALTANVTLPCGLGPYWLAVEAVDRMSRSGSPKPIFEIQARSLGRELYRLRYDRVPFEESHLIDAQRNFAKSVAGYEEFYNLVPVDLPKTAAGICDWFGVPAAPVEIIARDAAGNSSTATVNFYDGSSLHSNKGFRPKPDTLKLARLIDRYGGDCGAIGAAMIPVGRKLMLLACAAGKNVEGVTVHSATALEAGREQASLKHIAGRYWLGAIDSLEADGAMVAGDSVAVNVSLANGEGYFASVPVSSGRIFADEHSSGSIRSEDGVFEISFPKYSEVFFPLEAQLYFRLDRLGLDRLGTYALAPRDVPIAKQVTYEYRLGSSLPRGAGLYSVGGGGSAYLGGEFSAATGAMSVKANTLAPIAVKQDTLPPTLRRIKPGSGAFVFTAKPAVSFKVGDELSGIKDRIDVYIDGRWIIPVYDYETAVVTAIPHFNLDKGKHKLEINVSDKQGNVRRHTSEFTYGARKKK